MTFIIPIILDLLAAPLSALGAFLIGHGAKPDHVNAFIDWIDGRVPSVVMLSAGLAWGLWRIPVVHAKVLRLKSLLGLSPSAPVPIIQLPPTAINNPTSTGEPK